VLHRGGDFAQLSDLVLVDFIEGDQHAGVTSYVMCAEAAQVLRDMKCLRAW
jgi:hypothetical protein